MEKELILLDSSVLIDYFRKQRKERSYFLKLVANEHTFAVSVITRFEIMVGSSDLHQSFWERFFDDFRILPLNTKTIDIAVATQKSLQTRNKIISFPDLLIAATAIANTLPLATLNRRHFERVPELQVWRISE